MGRKRIKLEGSENCKAVHELLKSERAGVIRERLLSLKMGFSGEHTLQQISETLGRSRSTIQRWFDDYRTGGLTKVLKNEQGKGGGAPSELNEEVRNEIEKGLDKHEWRTVQQIADHLELKFNKPYNMKTVWGWVKKCAGTLRVPRPSHIKKNPEKVEEFKENFIKNVESLNLDTSKEIYIWVQDECRYGLHGVQRACWSKKGVRPIVINQQRYEWGYAYGALDCLRGEAIFVQTPTVNLKWTEVFLKEIDKKYPNSEHVVIWDNAGFHHDKGHEKLPSNFHLLPLPPYSPELNPVERLWDIVKDGICNKTWDTIEEMEEAVAENLKPFWQIREKVKNLIGSGWLRFSANSSTPTNIPISL